MKPPTRTWKRTLLTLSLFILAGAIINVAVAWGLTIHDPIGKELTDEENDAAWPTKVPASWPSKCTRLGSRFVGVSGDYYGTSVTLGEAESHSLNRESFESYRWGAGLPLRSLQRFEWLNYTYLSSKEGYPSKHIESTNIPRESIWQKGLDISFVKRRLPLGTVWPGFAINTIFYAAILWMLFTAPGFVRRRIRIKRGLCPACAYPVGSSDVCTECGAPLKRQ